MIMLLAMAVFMLNDDQKALIFMQAWDINPHPFLYFYFPSLFPFLLKSHSSAISLSLSLCAAEEQRKRVLSSDQRTHFNKVFFGEKLRKKFEALNRKWHRFCEMGIFSPVSF